MGRPERLARLRRLERLRQAERQAALATLAEAESRLGKARLLEQRSAELLDEAGGPAAPADGLALRARLGFRAGLARLVLDTARQSLRSGSAADDARNRLTLAERRLELVSTKLGEACREEVRAESLSDAVLARKLKGR